MVKSFAACAAAIAVLPSAPAPAAPNPIAAEVWTSDLPTPRPASTTGPALVLPRFTPATEIGVRVTFDEPVLAVRAFAASDADASLVAFTPGDLHVELRINNAPEGELLIVDLIDTLGTSGVAPLTRVLVAPFPADFHPAPDNARDAFDLIALLRLIDAADPEGDLTRDGLPDPADALAAIGIIGEAPARMPIAPLLSAMGTAFVPAGGVSRPVRLTIRDAFVEPDALELRVRSAEPDRLPDHSIVVVRDGGEVSILVAGEAGDDLTTSVRVEVSNGLASASGSIGVVIRPDRPPTARFTADAFLGVAPLTVRFDATTSTDELDNIAGVAWDFGDGSAGTGVATSHVFTTPGDHTVSCTLTDDSGLSSTAVRRITVAPAPFDLGARGGPGAITRDEAARFLWQAAFGPTPADIDEVISLGYEGWIDHQIAIPASPRRPFGPDVTVTDYSPVVNSAPDQLRHRVAWALVQVVTLGQPNAPQAAAYTYDMYLRHAFGHPATAVEPAASGTYRDLLAEATRQGPMGTWLTYVNNRKAHPATGIEPDENYARELMQLFTIGLWRLEPDGRRTRDPFGHDVPTFDTDTVRQFARVFTGFRSQTIDGIPSGSTPMRMETSRHEFGPKLLLDYPGAVPAGGVIPARAESEPNALADIDEAIDNLFHHPNCPPHVAGLLIRRFTTSNPSPAYVGRVAEAFRGGGPHGSGIRGDLRATVKAILLDDEARNPAYAANPLAGKVIEPFILAVAAGRLLGMTDPGIHTGVELQEHIGQTHYRTPSVFNFYRPDYAPPGSPIADAGLAAPELQILTEAQAIGMTEVVATDVLRQRAGEIRWNHTLRDELIALGQSDPAALVARVHEIFRLDASPGTLSIITRAAIAIPAGERSGVQRPNVAVYLYLLNPEARILR